MQKKKCILVVDDARIARKVLSNTLTKLGYDAVTVASGEEALLKLRELDCDAVITDMKMPEMDGIELIQKIRQLKPNIGVIMVSAQNEADSCMTAKTPGSFESLPKPVTMDQLERVLSKLLEEQ